MRSYAEREAGSVQGYLLRHEMHAPTISPTALLRLGAAEDDALQASSGVAQRRRRRRQASGLTVKR